jgi:ATP-dependent RNA helicase DDX46/PRP5
MRYVLQLIGFRPTQNRTSTKFVFQAMEETAALAADEKQQQIDREEVIRQRRERVEQWRREREAAKQAEMAQGDLNVQQPGGTASDTNDKTESKDPESQAVGAADTMDEDYKSQENDTGKNWSLEDDEDDDTMAVDNEEQQPVPALPDDGKFLALPKQDDDAEDEKAESLVSKPPVRRNMMTIGKGFGKPMNSNTSQNTNQTTSTPKKSKMQIGFGMGLGNKPNGLGATKKTVSTTMNVDKPATKPEISEQKMQVDQDDDIDPLEAYMVDVDAAVQRLNDEDTVKMKTGSSKSSGKDGRLSDDDDDGQPADKDDDDSDIGSDPEDILAMAAKRVKKKDLAPVDHSRMDYEYFRKDFYIEPPELKELTQDQIDLLRIELDGIKIRGVDCPKPIQKWTHCGLPSGCLEVIRKLKYEKPTPIQAQAIPAIMNGRDVIGVAKTGSGKTIAFLLPMFRHIKDQRPIENGEGPISVIMTPTRELAVQIHRECKPFLKVLGLRAVCAYGGSPIKDQIADLKRGAEIIVCTPGRMIDLLCANSGRVTNLRRVTYMVLDEADRMFDMGFEPQVCYHDLFDKYNNVILRCLQILLICARQSVLYCRS